VIFGTMRRFVTLEKAVGQTPLECLTRWRASQPALEKLPMSYAGRLDPMASGALLILIGDECKRQKRYHNLDKEYVVEIIFDITSDSGDVLGIVTADTPSGPTVAWHEVLRDYQGPITLPYPRFSAKTIGGVPLHTLALSGQLKLNELPIKTSRLYATTLLSTSLIRRDELVARARAMINSLPTVTAASKAAGRDFRRADVLQSWHELANTGSPADHFTVITLRCICSSGTYMRSLAADIGEKIGKKAMALSIHRTKIGSFFSLYTHYGLWFPLYKSRVDKDERRSK
jgi:tRNA pseudouridine(55) synthase